MSERIIRRLKKRSYDDAAQSSGDGVTDDNEVSTTMTTSSESNSILQVSQNPENHRDDPPDVNVAQLDVTAVEGRLLTFNIPNNTFYDKEEGGMENLRMTVVEWRKDTLVEETWLKVDGEKLILYGLPPKSIQAKV